MSRIMSLVLMAPLLAAPAAVAAADVPGHGGTRASLKVGYDYRTGEFEARGDKDRYKIRLLKGKDYHVSFAGEYPSKVSLFDPQGKLIKADEPSAGSLAGFEYRPDKDGTYQVLVQDFSADGNGEFIPAAYQVRVAPDCRADTKTACSLTVGPTVTGDFGGDGESDWLEIHLDWWSAYGSAIDDGGRSVAVMIHNASVTGRWASSPPSDHPAAGLMLPSVVDRGRHIMRSERSRWANLKRVLHPG
jgi:hypothetical protein